jgi:hypothetical protein
MEPVLAPPLLGATVNATLPFPEPLAPAVMVMNVLPLAAVAVQVHVPPCVTVTVMAPVPPLAANDRSVSPLRAKTHGAAFCRMVNVTFAMTSVALRSPPELRVTLTTTVPGPFPPPASATVRNAASPDGVTDQGHPALAVTAMFTDPPAKSTV